MSFDLRERDSVGILPGAALSLSHFFSRQE